MMSESDSLALHLLDTTFPMEIKEDILKHTACKDPKMVSVVMQLSRRHRDMARTVRYRGFVLADRYYSCQVNNARFSDIDLDHTSLILGPQQATIFATFMEWNFSNGFTFDIAPYIKHLTLSSSQNFVHFCNWLMRSTMELTYLKVNGEYFNANDLENECLSLFHSVGKLSGFHDRTGTDLFSFLPTQSLWFMRDLTVMLPTTATWNRVMLFCENIDKIAVIHAHDLTDHHLTALQYPVSSFCSKGRNKFTDQGIEHVVSISMSKLENLQLENMFLKSLDRIVPLLATCYNLKRIHINYTSIVKFEPFLTMVRMLVNLESLKMSVDMFEGYENAVQLFTMFFMGSKLKFIALSIQSADQREVFIKAIDQTKQYFRTHVKIGSVNYKISKCRA